MSTTSSSFIPLILEAATTAGGPALTTAKAIMIKVLHDKVIQESFREENTSYNYILCSNGKVYKSSDNQTVEEVLAADARHVKNIHALWMKHAPLRCGSVKLMEVFNDRDHKPILHVGVVYQYGDDDRKGLKDMIGNGFQLKAWENISERVKPTRYKDSLQAYLDGLYEDEKPINDEYTDEEVAVIACGEDGVNHILTDKGTLYRSITMDTNEKNVFEIFRENYQHMEKIETLWIKKAPTDAESAILQDIFKSNPCKPVLYIGHIHKYTSTDRQGLKNLIKAGFKLEAWETASQYIKPQYDECLRKYVEYLKEEVVKYPDSEPHDYTEGTVAVISCGEDRVTHLLTNQGVMYRNLYEPYTHAEKIFTSELPRESGSDITEIWIKNSPCADCAGILRRFFKDTPTKPVIHVGSIYNPDDQENRNGLLNLISDGFQIKVWETMNTSLYGKENGDSEQYVIDLEKEVHEKSHGQQVMRYNGVQQVKQPDNHYKCDDAGSIPPPTHNQAEVD